MKNYDPMLTKPIRNNSGTAMIQLLISLGLMGAIISGSMTIIQQQTQQIASLEDRAQYRALIEDIRMTLFSHDSCMASLSSIDFDVSALQSPLQLTLTTDSTPIRSDRTSHYYRTHIQKLELENKINTGLRGIHGDVYLADVALQGRSSRGSGLQFPKRVATKMIVEVDAGNIVSCASSNDPSAICTVMGMAFDPSTGQCVSSVLFSDRGICPQGEHVRGFNQNGNIVCTYGIGGQQGGSQGGNQGGNQGGGGNQNVGAI